MGYPAILLSREIGDKHLQRQLDAVIRSGASGYLVKHVGIDQIFAAVEEVHRGGAPMSSYIARKVVQSFRRQGPSDKSGENLSKRETDVLDYVSAGHDGGLVARPALSGRHHQPALVDLLLARDRLCQERVARAIAQFLDHLLVELLDAEQLAGRHVGHFLDGREAFLDQHVGDVVVDVEQARRIIEAWRVEYNTERPHSSLGDLTPQEFAESNLLRTEKRLSLTADSNQARA